MPFDKAIAKWTQPILLYTLIQALNLLHKTVLAYHSYILVPILYQNSSNISQIYHKTHSKKVILWLLDTIFELLYVIVHMTLWDIFAIFKPYGPKCFELYVIPIDSLTPLPP